MESRKIVEQFRCLGFLCFDGRKCVSPHFEFRPENKLKRKKKQMNYGMISSRLQLYYLPLPVLDLG